MKRHITYETKTKKEERSSGDEGSVARKQRHATAKKEERSSGEEAAVTKKQQLATMKIAAAGDNEDSLGG
ncbi:hypothetical protein QYF36_008724 [Acer negundo]|nr:hypothetical protein QYF36_008724 [Acer negundo]